MPNISRKDGHFKMKWALYFTAAFIFIFLTFVEIGPFYTIKQSILLSFNSGPPEKYVIIFDGGSTGTRINVFKFAQAEDGSPILKDQYFEQIKPGLSSFADKPNKATFSILNLLEKAKLYIPYEMWKITPVALQATAGLRLLPSHSSKTILEEVLKVLQKSPFHCDNDCVGILNGQDEGLFAWYTLNFLLERLTDVNGSVTILDLGGGSIQVAFTPGQFDTYVLSPKERIVPKIIHNKTMPIYAHSYLGLGLMSARLAILEMTSGSLDESEKSFSSPCISPQVKTKWKYNFKEYYVRGRKDKMFGFEACYADAVEFLGDSVDRPTELQKREIYAMSYFFDRATDMGILDNKENFCTVGKYFESCKNACSEKNPKHFFLCLDCSYNCALLHHGLGLPMGKKIMLMNEINNIEISWGLGAAFSLL